MTTFSSLRKRLAGMCVGHYFAAVIGIAIIGTIAFVPLNSWLAARTAISSATTSVATFDGALVWRQAVQDFADRHYTLVDPTAHAAFLAQWEHKHDHDRVLSTEQGTDLAIYEMMWSLGQRFDYYFPPEETQTKHEEADSTMAGIGLSVKEQGLNKAVKALGDKPTQAQVEPLLTLTEERPLVVAEAPQDDTPAGKAHLLKDDRIVAIGGEKVDGKTTDWVVSKIRGPVNTPVTISLARKDANGQVSTFDVTLTRAQVRVHVVKLTYKDKVAHVVLTNFQSQYAREEMAQALTEASQKATSAILDMRGNPGGDQEQLLGIAQMFLEKGVILKKVIRDGNHMVTVTFSVTPDKFVMTAQSDDGSPPQVKEGARQPLLVPVTMPIIVLIDGHSASAAEVIAGALQANGRARVMGEPSYGKGVGQDVVQLPYGRSMHITSFEFFPGGVKMDWVGIVPDIEMKQPADADPIDDPSTDYQLNAANFELIFTAVGNPQPARPRDQVDARRAELEKAHRADFQKEVQMREEVLKRAAEAAASGSTGPN